MVHAVVINNFAEPWYGSVNSKRGTVASNEPGYSLPVDDDPSLAVLRRR